MWFVFFFFNLKENYGVMADPTTTMRDPVFYRWHAFVDDICQEHKTTLPRYTTEQVRIFCCFYF